MSSVRTRRTWAAVAVFCGLAYASAASAQVKISQVYGGGGNTGSPTTNDYIEIYNAGAPQLLTGWSVQYASSTGTFSAANTTALPAITLGTGQYLLVQEAIGATVVAGQGPGLPAPQATATIAMAADTFKVALVSSTTPLASGTPTYAVHTTLVDFVGVGTSANWNDASASGVAHTIANNAPPASNAHAVYRLGCGANDTNNSRNDWAVGLPAPRNTATALSNGITLIGTALPLTVEELQTARLTATPFRCATIDLGVGTVVSVDTTSIGGGAVAMLDDGVVPDEIAGDGIYTAIVTVAAGTAPGTKSLPITVSDGGGNSGGSYISIEVRPTTTPNNDNCTTAQAVAVPSTTVASLVGATVESNPFATSSGAFPTGFTTGMAGTRGVWYTVVGNGNTLTATLCNGTIFDTRMMVMCGSCDGLSIIGINDDVQGACGAASAVTWCSAAGTTYYIWFGRFGSTAPTETYTLDIIDGAPCATAFPCTSCVGVAGPYTESEPGYGMHTNDGCTSTPNLFTDIAAPGPVASVIRGTGRGMIGNRDIDSYRFQATASGLISMTLDTLGSNAQAQLNSLAAGGLCPQVSVVNTPILVTRCATGTQTSAAANVTAGTWYVINVLGGVGIQVTPPATAFGGQMPGGTTYQYTLNVSISPSGACCFPDGTCTVGIESACTSPGVYQGDNTACHSIVTGTNVLEDITTDPLATQLALGDDASSGSIALPFVFNYFGNNRNSVIINSNGWLSFNANTGISTAQMRTNLAMPSGATVPNEFIAPYWDDLNQVTATADRISYMTRGTAPSRRFIVQWLVRIFNGTNPACVNFEAILYEGTNCIEFRYATVLPNGSLCGTAGTASFSAGLESLSGLVGANVTNLVASNTSILFCPTCPLPTGSCCVPLAACQITTQPDCLNAGGSYNGDNTSCTPDPCITGACCLPLGGCQDDLTPVACSTLLGTYRGDFSTCAGVDPPCPPSGTCCTATGSCSISTQANCSAPDQTWTLGGSCSPNPCQTGACCLTNGSCLIRTANGCSAEGGCYQGDGTLCTGLVTNYNGGGVPILIPDSNVAGVVLSLVVTDSYLISDLDFGFTFGSPLHTWYDDVNMSLKHVDTGTTRLLMNANGGDNSDLCGPYTLDDSAPTTFDAAAASEATGTACIPAGSYRPDNLLSGFNGENINGTWELTVWDDAGSDTGVLQAWSLSATASPCPAISQHPVNATGCEGGSASFSVVASGASLTYQWRKGGNPIFNGGNISGADTSTLTINPLGAGDAGSYDVVVTSGLCSVTSTAATLTVHSTPTIVTQPVGGAVAYGSPFVFTVGAWGGGLSYQWYRDGVPLVDGGTISGATTSMLSISSTVREDSGSYTVVVTNICGTITSEPAFLEVNGNATVSLVSPPCANTGQLVVDVLMSSSTSVVVGGQFFLAYDITLLDFVSASPGDAPFVTEVYEVVNEIAGEIDYAVGIADEGGTGTSANTVMARLTFNVLQDDCDLTPNLVTWRASGPNGAESKLSNSMGLQVNINPVNLGPTRLDNTDPVITVCPSNISVHAAAGSCNSAPVTYAAAATDNCTANPTIVFNPPSGSTFPPGTTPVLVTATDECGNSSTCTFDVINDGMVEVAVEVELGGGVMANGVFTRGITFALWNTTVDNLNPLHIACVTMSFSGDFPVAKTATATFLAPCQPTGYDCITGRDRLHTLRRTISPLPISGVAYSASFTGAKALIGGNLDDSKFIDIIDFGIYTTQDLTVAPGGANTACGQNPPGFLHADITGNGIVNSLDYSFIANNFLLTRENNCNGSTTTVVTADGSSGARDRDQPITSLTIAQLHERGLGSLAVMDLNQDGAFDLTDKALWDQGVRPNTSGNTGTGSGAPKSVQPLNLDTLPNPVP